MIVHHITHGIFNNIVTITKMHQVIAFFLSFLKKVQFCLQRAEIKNENVDCEVYKKPDDITFTPQDTGKLPRSNHEDLSDVQYLHLT